MGQPTPEVAPSAAFPGPGVVTGWEPSSEVQLFDAQNLFDLVNGQADAFFAYNFAKAAVQEYTHTDGGTLRIEIWELQSPADAYGLFSTFRAGTPVPVGNQGDVDPGRRLDFWQDRFLVRLFAPQAVGEEGGTSPLESLAEAVSSALPAGGEEPALLDRLPAEGLIDQDTLYFHEEISIQDDLWLGGQNILELGPETEGVLARYELGEGSLLLLLIKYPDGDAASTALEALRSAGVEGLIAAGTNRDVMGAAFGMGDSAQAEALLDGALSQ
jgi:hypothetical protein